MRGSEKCPGIIPLAVKEIQKVCINILLIQFILDLLLLLYKILGHSISKILRLSRKIPIVNL